MTTVVSTLIELDENGVAWVSGTKIKVIEVATDKLAHGSSPEEMHFQYPHLSLAQIHAVTRSRCFDRAVRWRRADGRSCPDLEMIAKIYDPEDMINNVEYLPLS